ncbi:hypothetical protein RFI_10572 [Reticulomyxa filosa]|uniref:Uncharacterized protein n=1 Tax=Reticulomyxa filosa TaxID=46433 RepID=X6NJT0_RETFI|nr:hypothetical protein RFI_10572 [Reticulomyxa filosa]|eukprot:ETO26565.1 hypothetical protein RFI_10572 [Reticulomyxa filosa]
MARDGKIFRDITKKTLFVSSFFFSLCFVFQRKCFEVHTGGKHELGKGNKEKNAWINSIYLRDFGILQEKAGEHVLYQSKYYTQEQFHAIRHKSVPIIFLFGDNEDDNTRDKRKRQDEGYQDKQE